MSIVVVLRARGVCTESGTPGDREGCCGSEYLILDKKPMELSPGLSVNRVNKLLNESVPFIVWGIQRNAGSLYKVFRI